MLKAKQAEIQRKLQAMQQNSSARNVPNMGGFGPAAIGLRTQQTRPPVVPMARPNVPRPGAVSTTTSAAAAAAPTSRFAQTKPPQTFNAADIQAQVEAAKARIQRNLGKTPTTTAALSAAPTVNIDAAARGGLKAEIHPLLRKDSGGGSASKDNKSGGGHKKRSRNAGAAGLAPLPKFSTIKANQSVSSPNKKQKLDAQSQLQKYEKDPTKNPYFDSRLMTRDTSKILAPGQRKKRQFNFVQQGKYVHIAEKEREKAKLEEVKTNIAEKIEEEKKRDPDADLIDESLLVPNSVPEVEWWDEPLLSEKRYSVLDEAGDSGMVLEGESTILSHLIQHPIRIITAYVKKSLEPLTLSSMLTKKERKKLRRQRRMEEHKEKQEKIRLGLLPPDPPKVRLANLMRVLGQQAVQDPTKVEAEVRKQVAERRRVHDETNASRKLTDEQRKEKIKQKIESDATNSLWAAVYKVKILTHPQHKFKVTANANQLGLTGVTIINPTFSLVVVEGGAKSLKAYKKLMLRRINWTDSNERNPAIQPDKLPQHINKSAKDGKGDKEEAEAKEPEIVVIPEDRSDNQCSLVWEGEIPERSFNEFRTRICPTEEMARMWLSRAQVDSYWDIAKKYDPEEHDLGNAL
ncbi:U4/U5/U6 small nuclear ribonucleoprotein prp3 [Mycoemilia scoparia]|uniref:U4/U5/U6 small nuclear ribonucleoprotein prp3 n=1 Tax=Mycoemilia scoparia TaxID=417184 RepID=A0A9W8DNX8_9FUNG|nr:U4/U5/U6 small nuclear ribonucleoprotein prp3 [Mycoemilia scoparia]